MNAATSRFRDQFVAGLRDGTFVRLVLSQPLASDRPLKVLARRIELRGVPHLSLTLRFPTRDETRNLSLAEAGSWLAAELAHYRGALLNTTGRDWQLQPTGRLIGHKPAHTVVPPSSHDRPKQYFLDDRARDWLPASADKRRQVERYVEILAHLGRDCGWDRAARPLTIADMGCGKGLLTFAAWHLLHRLWNQPARVMGVELRPALVDAANELARRIGATGLEFVAGTIDAVSLPPLDGLIALHACDTATDDALRRGIAAGAKLIVVAPCCHKEVRSQLGQPAPLASVLAHGLMAERFAEWATDGLRALFLEWAGYRAKIVEFVASEHTPKNLLLAGVRAGRPFADPAARERIVALKSFLGLRRHALDELLDR